MLLSRNDLMHNIPIATLASSSVPNCIRTADFRNPLKTGVLCPRGMGIKTLFVQGQAMTPTTWGSKGEMKPPFDPFIKLRKEYKPDDFKSPSSVGGGQRTPSGAIQIPYVILSPAQEAFYSAAATWTLPFDWIKWSETGKGKSLVKGEPRSIEKASIEEIQKLLTSWIRNDRFCEGAFAGFCEQGLAGRVLQRIQVLEEESRGSKRH